MCGCKSLCVKPVAPYPARAKPVTLSSAWDAPAKLSQHAVKEHRWGGEDVNAALLISPLCLSPGQSHCAAAAAEARPRPAHTSASLLQDVPVEALTTVKPYCNEIHAQAQLWLKRDPKASYEAWKKCLPIRGVSAFRDLSSGSFLPLADGPASPRLSLSLPYLSLHPFACQGSMAMGSLPASQSSDTST